MTTDDSVSLRHHLEARIDAVEKSATARAAAQDKAIQARLIAAQEALLKVEAATERRFESVNEFRAALADQARLTMPRSESEAMHRASHERFNAMVDTMNERMNALAGRVGTIESTGSGRQAGWASVVSIIALISAVMGIILVLFNRAA